MSISSRFAVGVHILTLLEKSEGKPTTSDWIAGSASTNPAVVRRLIAMLGKAGLTHSQLGAGGGTLLAKPASAITLLDVYRAVEDGELFALHNEAPCQRCMVGRNIQEALQTTLDRAQHALETELGATTIADISQQVVACNAPKVPT
ncbi:MAG: transcriptional regulator [Cyanobacteria bacterium RYN_339]|nr:transcriptional regulator [Cyanobacteria bacterium RYN_339]